MPRGIARQTGPPGRSQVSGSAGRAARVRRRGEDFGLIRLIKQAVETYLRGELEVIPGGRGLAFHLALDIGFGGRCHDREPASRGFRAKVVPGGFESNQVGARFQVHRQSVTSSGNLVDVELWCIGTYSGAQNRADRLQADAGADFNEIRRAVHAQQAKVGAAGERNRFDNACCESLRLARRDAALGFRLLGPRGEPAARLFDAARRGARSRAGAIGAVLRVMASLSGQCDFPLMGAVKVRCDSVGGHSGRHAGCGPRDARSPADARRTR